MLAVLSYFPLIMGEERDLVYPVSAEDSIVLYWLLHLLITLYYVGR